MVEGLLRLNLTITLPGGMPDTLTMEQWLEHETDLPRGIEAWLVAGMGRAAAELEARVVALAVEGSWPMRGAERRLAGQLRRTEAEDTWAVPAPSPAAGGSAWMVALLVRFKLLVHGPADEEERTALAAAQLAGELADGRHNGALQALLPGQDWRAEFGGQEVFLQATGMHMASAEAVFAAATPEVTSTAPIAGTQPPQGRRRPAVWLALAGSGAVLLVACGFCVRNWRTAPTNGVLRVRLNEGGARHKVGWTVIRPGGNNNCTGQKTIIRYEFDWEAVRKDLYPNGGPRTAADDADEEEDDCFQL